ncbi:hypothetical protein B0T09DRAFT_383580 [Sordaria sp. MPI-SDFR-AT-0083]|nr:hypothetical protein B0T09DRAFT_383580 [Sordaria sp. MPI-SDFR-AT-0083]
MKKLVLFIVKVWDAVEETAGFNDPKYGGTEAALGKFEIAFFKQEVPAFQYIDVPAVVDEQTPPFILGLADAKVDIEAIEDLQKNNKTEELNNFRLASVQVIMVSEDAKPAGEAKPVVEAKPSLKGTKRQNIYRLRPRGRQDSR